MTGENSGEISIFESTIKVVLIVPREKSCFQSMDRDHMVTFSKIDLRS